MDVVREEIAALGPWHHDVELPGGLRTGDLALARSEPGANAPTLIDPRASLERLVSTIFPDGLAGKSVLDCACNGGGYLFAARDLGAGSAFGFDVRAHWIAQAEFLARQLGNDGLSFAMLDLADLPGLDLPQFDVTLFQGIFYHLPDPVAGLKIAADHTRELLVLNTATLPQPHKGLIFNPESETLLMSGVHRVAWLPTGEPVLRDLLAWCGFPHVRCTFERRDGRWGRIELVAARDEATFACLDTAGSEPEPRPDARARALGRLARLMGR